MFLVSKINAVELVAGNSLNYDNDTGDRLSTCFQTVLRFHILLKAMIHNLICLILMQTYHKSAAVETSAVFRTT